MSIFFKEAELLLSTRTGWGGKKKDSRSHQHSFTQTWFWDPWPPRNPEGPCCLYLLTAQCEFSHNLRHPHSPSAFRNDRIEE